MDNQWIVSDYKKYLSENNFKFDPNSEEEEVALASRKQTDVFSITHDTIPSELNLDPLKYGSAMKGAYYSAAFILRTLVAEKLDIDPEELNIGNIIKNEDGGEIRLNDQLPNGAGFCIQITDFIKEILQEVVQPTSKGFISSLYKEEHTEKCYSSCHSCLKVYRNINYHGLLDWRLGISLLKTFIDSNYKCGFYNDLSTPELKDWKSISKSLCKEFCSNFPACSDKNYENLQGFSVKEKNFVVVHPFWNEEKIKNSKLKEHNIYKCIDTFNLLRRPSWIYKNLHHCPQK